MDRTRSTGGRYSTTSIGIGIGRNSLNPPSEFFRTEVDMNLCGETLSGLVRHRARRVESASELVHAELSQI